MKQSVRIEYDFKKLRFSVSKCERSAGCLLHKASDIRGEKMDWVDKLLHKLNAEEKRKEYDDRITNMTKEEFDKFSEWFHNLSDDEKFYIYFIERAMRL
ncbi:MAG: hypothetical protein AMS17_18440 [Spirochaetes bacterium DG_61]|nr:MAG: hypothetical protein AMS17_18440 [Spirochaetes bacterium DG_61]